VAAAVVHEASVPVALVMSALRGQVRLARHVVSNITGLVSGLQSSNTILDDITSHERTDTCGPIKRLLVHDGCGSVKIRGVMGDWTAAGRLPNHHSDGRNSFVVCLGSSRYLQPKDPWELARQRQNLMVFARLVHRSSGRAFCAATYHMPCLFDVPPTMVIHCALAAQKLQVSMQNEPDEKPAKAIGRVGATLKATLGEEHGDTRIPAMRASVQL
jgi:hypothetical protein